MQVQPHIFDTQVQFVIAPVLLRSNCELHHPNTQTRAAVFCNACLHDMFVQKRHYKLLPYTVKVRVNVGENDCDGQLTTTGLSVPTPLASISAAKVSLSICNCTGVSSSSSAPSFVQSTKVAPAEYFSNLGGLQHRDTGNYSLLSTAGKHHAVQS